MLNTSFSPWPSFTQEESQAVSEVLLSNKVNYWTGSQGKQFEKNFAKFSDCNYAIALANGTLALELALRGLDIGINDEVVVSPRGFIASVSCVLSVGATPVFADVAINSGNITAQYIESVITPKTKAIICVHLAGLPCEMDEIMALANQHNIKVIEDCAQAHGAKYKGQSVGSIGHISAWSFCQDKIMTTGGEGGMIGTNDKGLYQKMWSYKDHGKSYQKIHTPDNRTSLIENYHFVHDSFGSNYRMTEIQAVIGNIQLGRMEDWQQKRQHNAHKIWQVAKQFKALIRPNIPNYMVHACYKAYVLLDEQYLKPDWNASIIRQKINELGVPCYAGSCAEIYQESAFDNTNFRPKIPLKNAHNLANKVLMFLVHPTLTQAEINQTVKILTQVMSMAST